MHQDTSLSLILSLPKQTEQVTKTYKLKRLCWLTCLEVQKSPCRGLAWGCVETAPRCIRFKQATLSLPCHKCFGSKCVMQKGNSWCGLSTFALACLKRVFTPGKVPTLMVSKQRNLLGTFQWFPGYVYQVPQPNVCRSEAWSTTLYPSKPQSPPRRKGCEPTKVEIAVIYIYII